MPDPNFPRRDGIPDMTLGDRSEKPSSVTPLSDAVTPSHPPKQSVEASSAYSAQPEPAKSAPVSVTPPTWQDGDRVLAPWEPVFLYPGVIKQILLDEARGDQALIEFDDGGEGWVFLFSLCPVEVREGQQVQFRRHGNPNYTPAEIVEVSGEDVRVRDGNGSKWTTLAALRIPCIENGPAAVPTKLAPWQSPTPDVASNTGGGGTPSWVITVGIIILLAFVRIGCRAMMQN